MNTCGAGYVCPAPFFIKIRKNMRKHLIFLFLRVIIGMMIVKSKDRSLPVFRFDTVSMAERVSAIRKNMKGEAV